MRFEEYYKQELSEKFVKGFYSPMGYVEVFLNPTQREVKDLDRWREAIRGYIDGKGDLYIWEHDAAEHEDAEREMDFGPQSIPIYLYLEMNMVSFSTWSAAKLTKEQKEKGKNIVKNNPNVIKFMKTDDFTVMED